MRALRTVGVPYTDGEIETAVGTMQTQARAIAAEVESQQGPTGLADKEIIALTAYLQRLGTDIKWKRPQPQLPFFTGSETTSENTAPAAPRPSATQPSTSARAALPSGAAKPAGARN